MPHSLKGCPKPQSAVVSTGRSSIPLRITAFELRFRISLRLIVTTVTLESAMAAEATIAWNFFDILNSPGPQPFLRGGAGEGTRRYQAVGK
jgi:hypothetical protein